MVNKKDLIIVALATFCLTTTLFMIRPTRSNPGVGEYDPWADLKEDGTIDIYDAILLADAYGTSGDPTKSVNVTNPRAKVIEFDLNISVHGDLIGFGQNATDVFATEGYDRMFVSAAIIDISNYTPNSTFVTLLGVNWYWGMSNGTYLKTYTDASYSRGLENNSRVDIQMYNPSELPVSSRNSAEFAVATSQCSVSFYANTWFNNGWVLIRVSVYLAVGTTSTPFIQNTYVTNWPYYQPEPAYQTIWPRFNTSIMNGVVLTSTSISVGGYSRMYIDIVVINASYYGVPVKTTITLNSIIWDEYGGGCENVSPNILNATYYGTYLPVCSQQTPPEFKTKSYSCHLNFEVSSEAFSGWIEWYPKVYLRNE